MVFCWELLLRFLQSFSGVSAEMRLPWQRHIRLLRACMKMHQTVLLLMLTL
ncbi:hypothetical protein ACS0TY_013104 [Phlomoides rotata]